MSDLRLGALAAAGLSTDNLPGPPAEPGVRLSSHPVLHRLVAPGDPVGPVGPVGGRPWRGDRCYPVLTLKRLPALLLAGGQAIFALAGLSLGLAQPVAQGLIVDA